MIISKQIIIKGLVQGVGFRPSIYRIAISNNVHGTVANNNTGVIIIVEGDEKCVENFIIDIPQRIPIASSINSINISDIEINGYDDFQISKSISMSNDITEVSPDISICDECLADIETQSSRIDYPLTNCTNCGPRFTIIKDLPYDRSKTTMDVFPMCKTCKNEYINILDRRFHAQPVACNNCGPKYTLYYKENEITDIKTIIATSGKLIDEGKILAIKGLGGYHLACDAFNDESVNKLRLIKNRDGKPFALLFSDIDAVKAHLDINITEEKLISGWRKPIVLLKIKNGLSSSISIGLVTIGAMLPYMAFHHILFKQIETNCIVLTSGNISDEPIIISDDDALQTFGNICDGTITYNRHIHNRTDDSVTMVVNNTERTIRRSRGYAPSPIELNLNTEGIFAAGAELVVCFAIGRGSQAIVSQHIGDLKNLETLEFYKESINRFSRLFRFKPILAVMDMHPDYLSSKYVEKMNISNIKVQHHHAHIASCMAEHKLDEKVIGISFDGTGYGDDGNIWGGEFFICNLIGYERINHFEYIMQPGGDAVTKYPWRMMTAYLYHYFGKDVTSKYPFLFNGVDNDELKIVLSMLNKKLNTPITSSAGRLFDAVSALLDVCRVATYHAEAPMQLESIADESVTGSYTYNYDVHISFKSTFVEMIKDIENKIPISVISSKFHNTIVNIIVEQAKIIGNKAGISKIVLSGGSFQNKILLKKVEMELAANNFSFFTQSKFPSNDGGIALGQLAIAAKRRELGII